LSAGRVACRRTAALQSTKQSTHLAVQQLLQWLRRYGRPYRGRSLSQRKSVVRQSRKVFTGRHVNLTAKVKVQEEISIYRAEDAGVTVSPPFKPNVVSGYICITCITSSLCEFSSLEIITNIKTDGTGGWVLFVIQISIKVIVCSVGNLEMAGWKR
jgi:hypothetical protein